MTRPERRGASRSTALLGAASLALSLGGCIETGDFGRVKPTVWNDIVATTGAVAAARRGEPVSLSPLTDDETELRDRAWRYLVPARTRPYLDRLLAELVATRILPPDMIPPDTGAYFAGLLQSLGRSPTSLYRRLSEDVAADTHLAEPFAAVAVRVLKADRVRLKVLARTGDVPPPEAGDATARVAENRCLVAWVTGASAFRLGAYRYALDHLVIQAPQLDAAPTDRALARLAAERQRLDALGVPPLAATACLGEPAPAPLGIATPARALVRKG